MWRVAVVVLVVAAPLRADGLDDFLDEYQPHHDRLTAHLWHNVKLAGTVTGHDPARIVAFSAVADDRVLVRRQTVTVAGEPPEETACVVTPDQAVRLRREADGWRHLQTFVVHEPGDRSQSHMYHDARGGQEPLRLSVFVPDTGRGPTAYNRPLWPGRRDGFTARRTEFREVPVIEAYFPRGDEYPERTVYLRPADLLVSRVEVRTSSGLRIDRPRPTSVRRVYEIDYGPTAAGELPFPTAIRGTLHESNGVVTPLEEVVFSEYHRHAPTPDELDTVKQFGFAPSSPPPRPQLPPPGEYLSDTFDGTIPTPAVTPPPNNDLTVRGGLLIGLIAAIGLAYVWWRR